MDTFDKISELLKDHHMTQADLSRATGISTGRDGIMEYKPKHP